MCSATSAGLPGRSGAWVYLLVGRLEDTVGGREGDPGREGGLAAGTSLAVGGQAVVVEENPTAVGPGGVGLHEPRGLGLGMARLVGI